MRLGDLAVGEHLETGSHALQQSGNGVTDRVGHQQACGHSQLFLFLRHIGGFLRQDLGHARVQRGCRRVAQGLHQQTLEAGFDGDHVQFAGRAVDLLDDGRRQRNAHAAGQFHRILGQRCMLGQGFDDGAHVADVHAVFQQQLEHFLEG
ncbi:hypothetical protein D3C86_1782650 [compost metagenome]